jgi:hypothetical protein
MSARHTPKTAPVPRIATTAALQGKNRLIALLLAVRIDVVDRLLHSRDLFGLFVGDLGLELIFEGHDQLNHVERIGTEVVKKGRLVLDLGFIDAKLFSDDLLDALFDAFHADLQLGKIPRIIAKRSAMQTPGRDKNGFPIGWPSGTRNGAAGDAGATNRA